jgi:hypothetical protein
MTAPTDRSPPSIQLQMRWARRQIRSAVFVCVIFALLQIAFAVIDYFNFEAIIPRRMMCIGLGFAAAIGIALGSRIVAILVLLYFGYCWLPNVRYVFTASFPNNIYSPAIAIFFCYCAYRGVRGTFAYQRLKRRIAEQRNS